MSAELVRNGSALEAYSSNSRSVDNIEIFTELFCFIVVKIYLDHPVPVVVDSRMVFGAALLEDPRLAEIFGWTIRFLEGQNIIQKPVLCSRSSTVTADKTDHDSPMYALTPKGLLMLSSDVGVDNLPAGSPKNFLEILKVFVDGNIRARNYIESKRLVGLIMQMSCSK
ncbi:hypothetical protein [Methylorubrum thiocyanatum]|uniref:hypothetical protein n=1 Tax=Methylorubrum thiocyanatum TaxID=47958 RepID=UPI0035C7E2DF